MENLDCKKIYTRQELENQKPSGYKLLEKNYHHFNSRGVTYDRYKILDVIDDVGLYKDVSVLGHEVVSMEGIILIEMVYPES